MDVLSEVLKVNGEFSSPWSVCSLHGNYPDSAFDSNGTFWVAPHYGGHVAHPLGRDQGLFPSTP